MTDSPTPSPDLRDEVTIPLAFPITVDGREISELKMRRPKVKDSLTARRIKGDEVERGIWLMATLCDVAPEHIHELDEVDSDKLETQYAAFRGKQVDA